MNVGIAVCNSDYRRQPIWAALRGYYLRANQVFLASCDSHKKALFTIRVRPEKNAPAVLPDLVITDDLEVRKWHEGHEVAVKTSAEAAQEAGCEDLLGQEERQAVEHFPAATMHAAKLAKAHGVDLTQIKGTAQDGKITKKDVQAVIDG